jgi:hypothetical protein
MGNPRARLIWLARVIKKSKNYKKKLTSGFAVINKFFWKKLIKHKKTKKNPLENGL